MTSPTAERPLDDHKMANETPGRSTEQHTAKLPAGVLGWNCITQKNSAGQLIFQYATDFLLAGRPIEDRVGERLLDVNGLRVDNSRLHVEP